MPGGGADLHTHTYYSGFNRVLFIPHPESVTPPEKMVETAIEKGLDVICVTDHNEIQGAWQAERYVRENDLEIEVVAGEEITSADGEVLGLFLQGFIPRDLSAEETIERIHDQGGLAVAPHPFSYRCPCLGTKIKVLDLDGVEVLNAAHRDPYVNRLAQLEFRSLFAHTAGSDAHAPAMLGDAYTGFPGQSAEDLYHAIKRKETEPQGASTPLRHWIRWCMEVAHGVFQKLSEDSTVDHGPNDPLEVVDQMRRRYKLIALGGCMAFMLTPLPLICGMAAEGWIRYKGWKKWEEFGLHCG